MSRKRLMVAQLAALSSVVALSACSSGAEGGGSDDNTITFAVADFETGALDPAMMTNTEIRTTRYLMWDSLLEIGAEGELVPGIAESWEMSEDGQSWTFVIREGVKFHNGEALGADDVKFSLDRMRDENAANGNAGDAIRMIKDVELVDDSTVTIHTNGIQLGLPFLVSSHASMIGVVMPKDYLLEEGGETFDEQRTLLEEAPIGSGPFQFVENVPGDSMTFEAVESHWRQTPAIDRVEILRVTEEATQVSMLQAGDVDIINISPDQTDSLESAGFDIRTVPASSEIGLIFPGPWREASLAKPAGDPQVRKALSLAIDRESIINSVLGGYAELKTTPFNTTPLTADINEEDYADWAVEANRYDPEEAKRLLADAGYPDGFDFKFFTFPRPGVPALGAVAEIVAAQWAEIGVNAEIVPTDYTTYREHYVEVAADDTYNAGDVQTWGTAPRFDPYGALASYVAWEGGSVQPIKDPELDALIGKAGNTLDDGQRQELIKKVYEQYLDAWTTIEIAMADTVFAVNADAVGDWRTIEGYPFLGRAFETIQAP